MALYEGYKIGRAAYEGFMTDGGPFYELKELLEQEGKDGSSFILQYTAFETKPKFRWSTRLKQWIPLPKKGLIRSRYEASCAIDSPPNLRFNRGSMPSSERTTRAKARF
jgi:hypothetical protein